jgi:uncharacterized protein
MNKPNPLTGILRLLFAHGREIDTRIRMQKSVYLLKRHGFSEFSKLRFVYFHYGPYSQQLSDVLQELVAAELVAEEREEKPSDQTRYSYRLTEKGEKWLEANGVDVPARLASDTDVLRRSHWRSLELASTAIFLLKERNSENVDVAFSRALELKPECRDFSPEAKALVEHFAN